MQGNRRNGDEINAPSDVLNKLSDALIRISQGDPLVALRNEILTQFRAIYTRFDAIDKATELQHEDMVRVPTQVDKATGALRDVLEQTMRTHAAEAKGELGRHIAQTDERFTRVDVLFVEGEKRTQQLRAADALALAAALQAAKEAVAEQNRSNTTAIAKSEAAVSEQIKQLQVSFDGVNQSTNDKIDDIKSRLDRGEGGVSGSSLVQNERRLNSSLYVAVISAFISAFSLIAFVFVTLHH